MELSRIIRKLPGFLARSVFCLEREIIFELDLSGSLKAVEPVISLQLSWGTEQDVLGMDEENYEYDRKGKKYVLGRMKKGDELMLVFHEGMLVGYHLVMKGAMELAPSKIIDLPPTKVYLYKGFVRESFRGKRIIDHLIYITARDLKKRGFRKLIMVVATDNTPMLKVIKRMAFKPVGTITFVKILGYTLPFVSKKTFAVLRSNA